MIEKVIGCALEGIEAQKVEVEVNVSRGAKFLLVGLPDNAVKESHYRISAALKNIGFKIPVKEIIINLAPADLKKEGSAYDLPIALGILCASGQIKLGLFKDYVVMGELSLDGTLRPVRGVLSMAIKAKKLGMKGIIIPANNLEEASLVKGLNIIGVKSLQQLIDHFLDKKPILKKRINRIKTIYKAEEINFSDVIGQQVAKRAIEIAAAGSHNILLIGPPGSGKSMLAKRIPTILPNLSESEMLETTKIYSYLGKFNQQNNLIFKPPFRSPHHTISNVALVGGGSNPRPGEISLAHNGVLFLDELPEFKRVVLEVLRQPLEEGRVTISRASGSVDFPSNIMLVAAMNPTPNGNYFENTTTSQSFYKVQQYLSKLSQPLLDRIDLQIEVESVSIEKLTSVGSPEENSETIKKRVQRVRDIQFKRQGKNNALLNSKEILAYCELSIEALEFLRNAANTLKFSARSFNRIKKISRTIADLDCSVNIKIEHVAEAIQYRSLERLKQFLY
jgi:magnesium chelatase family protein